MRQLILVVEDEPAIAESIAYALDRLGSLRRRRRRIEPPGAPALAAP
jgi:DNA-binding response OmpR family regulator